MRSARHQIDLAAHAAGAVEHRDIALGDLHFGDVGGQKAREIESVVDRQINANAVDGERHLPAIETAHIDILLVAGIAGNLTIDARRDIDRAVERRAGKCLHLSVGDRVAAEGVGVLTGRRTIVGFFRRDPREGRSAYPADAGAGAGLSDLGRNSKTTFPDFDLAEFESLWRAHLDRRQRRLRVHGS